jgi:GDP-4-dehydro-6-deoxy-D-mannose reductase
MRILVTGATGFIGRHLASHLLGSGHDVHGLARHARRLPFPIAVADVNDSEALARVLRNVRPEGIVHLAAQSSAGASFTDSEATYRANFLGSLRLFEAVSMAVRPCRVLWVGSSDEYGAVEPADLPVHEATPLRPISPYGVSKASADLAAYQWSYRGLDVVRVRPFNATGPGQSERFVCADFARQIAAAERSGQPPIIRAGSLDVARDFLDVRDLVAAMAGVLLTPAATGVFNICSGIGRTPREIAAELFRLSGHAARIEIEPGRLRPAEIPRMVGSAESLRRAIGWSPQIAWTQTLADVLADWRDRSAGRDGG